MKSNAMRRRISALGTVVGLGIALPFALAAPAQAQPILNIDKSHEGNFARGGQGVYTITLSNSGDEGTNVAQVTDNLPAGLTVTSIGGTLPCMVTNGGSTVQCNGPITVAPNASFTLSVSVSVADDAPCSVTNTVTVADEAGSPILSDSDPTTITGGDCDGGNGGNGDGGGSILPINLNGVITMFNNISVNNNINSPGASNNSRQNFGVTAP
ncbi:hypothetical protein AB0D99_18460 [Streptomyces sp. NPDC047971]|uniref:hypothetical protein n=1 Tax=Streptomyces sp. NPDC047971 TaxID=3154499 RepID=UPI0033EB0D55